MTKQKMKMKRQNWKGSLNLENFYIIKKKRNKERKSKLIILTFAIFRNHEITTSKEVCVVFFISFASIERKTSIIVIKYFIYITLTLI